MNRNWFPYLTVILLLGLLVLLATLQYRWLGQISDAESVRLKSRLADDTLRFARDFDQEIQNAFFTLQAQPEDLEAGNEGRFLKRFLYWKQKAANPDLIKDIYVFGKEHPDIIKKFNRKTGSFEVSKAPGNLTAVRKRIESNPNTMSAAGNFLLMPVLSGTNEIHELVVRKKAKQEDEVVEERLLGGPPEVTGYVLIEIDPDVVKKKILPALVEKYFTQEGVGSFEVSVTDENGASVFSTHGKNFEKGDSTARFFSLRPGDFTFFARDAGKVIQEERIGSGSKVVVRENVSGSKPESPNGRVLRVDLKGPEVRHSRISVFDEDGSQSKGIWSLNVRHSSGSLEKFVTDTRNRNLAISFGILSILALGMVLIVLSTQRARALAKRQLEFVSSVSHEFRTPLAVIYSAGENISDGVVEDREKLATYGEMIKREGTRLSAMVEQILEYAGANSNRRSYRFVDSDAADLAEEAIAECAQLIEEKGFVIERDFENDLPSISVDRSAVVQAVQNLLANSIKYSNGNRLIRVLAIKRDHGMSISVVDRGIGISKRDLKHIFEPFYRSKSVVDEQIGGNGLGLSLVKEIVDAHGGKVSVESESGKGSTFTIWFPRKGL